MKEALFFIATVAVGYLGAAIVGSWLNWPEAGAVFAIAFVGAVLLHERKQK